MLNAMDINIDVRRKQVENLNQFIADSRKRFDEILHKLGWSEDKLSLNANMVACKEDKTHWIPITAVQQHVEKCLMKKLEYSPKDELLSEPCNDPLASILIDDSKKREIFMAAQKTVPNFTAGWTGKGAPPMTADRLTSMYSADERLALYNYARENTRGPEVPPEFNITQAAQTSENQLTHEERLEQERNAKRRRIKYKAVHTKRKNHTEVLRNVIENQMDAYKDWIVERDGGEREPSVVSSHSETRSDSRKNVYEETLSEAEKWSRKHGLENNVETRKYGLDSNVNKKFEYEENHTITSASGSDERRYKRYRQSKYGGHRRSASETHSKPCEDNGESDISHCYEYRDIKRLKYDVEEDQTHKRYRKNENRLSPSKYEHRKIHKRSSTYDHDHTRIDEHDRTKFSRLEEYDKSRRLEENDGRKISKLDEYDRSKSRLGEYDRSKSRLGEYDKSRISNVEENGRSRRSSYKKQSKHSPEKRSHRNENGDRCRPSKYPSSDSNHYRYESSEKYRYSKRYDYDDYKPDIAIIERLREVDQSRKALLAEEANQ